MRTLLNQIKLAPDDIMGRERYRTAYTMLLRSEVENNPSVKALMALRARDEIELLIDCHHIESEPDTVRPGQTMQATI